MADRARTRIAGIVIAIMTTLGVTESGRAEVAELLQKLNVTAYSRNTKPPDFNGRTEDSQTLSLAMLRGKVVLLNFWASWCQECRAEMPMFERLHREFKARGLNVVGINVREDPKAVREYSKTLGLTFPLVLDPKGEINAAYGVIGLPTTFLFGRDGRAVALAIGPRAWTSAPARSLIQTLLAEPNSLKSTR